MTEEDAYHELCAYTLEHARGDASFIHQHVVDAFAAQSAEDTGKPIAITFALVGLFLRVERQSSGRQVQRAHMQLARQKGPWPAFPLPSHRGSMTCRDVLAVPSGPARDRAIDAWCATVWEAFAQSREQVVDLVRQRDL